MKTKPLIILLYFLCGTIQAISSLSVTQEYSIGSKAYFIVDKNRKEILTKDTTDYRRIAIQTFYPSTPTNKCSKQLQSPYGEKIKIRNCLNTDILKGQEKYPIVILSPGFGGSYLMNMTLAEEIASNGYYVINVGHTFTNSTPTFPDGLKIDLMSMDTLKMESDNFIEDLFKTRLNTYISIQKEDIISVLDKLTFMLDEDHLNSVDLDNIACIGYSAGGATSADVCAIDSRIKAGININGVLYGDAWKYSIQQPFLYINADYSSPKKAEIEMLGGQNTIDSLMNFYNKRKKELSSHSKNDFYELTLFNSTHHNFSDWALTDQSFCGKTNPKECLDHTYLFIGLFLDKYLKKFSSYKLDTSHKTKNYNFEIIKTVTNKN